MLDVLLQVAVFQLIPSTGLVRLAKQGQRRFFPAGSHLMRQGEVSDSLHVITTGRVRVERSHAGLGRPVRLALLGPGEVVGEIGVLDEGPRTATVTAVEDTETMQVDGATLTQVILDYPDVAIALLRVLSKRIRSTYELLDRELRRGNS